MFSSNKILTAIATIFLAILAVGNFFPSRDEYRGSFVGSQSFQSGLGSSASPSSLTAPVGICNSGNSNYGLYYSCYTSSSLPIGAFFDQYNSSQENNVTVIGLAARGNSPSTSTNNFFQIGGMQVLGTHRGAGRVQDIIGYTGDAVQNGTGDADFMYSALLRLFVQNSGNAGTGFGLFIASPQVTGSGDFGNLEAIHVEPFTVGTSSNYAFNYDNGTDGFYITGQGKTGIGVVSPTYRLDVDGDVRISATGNEQWIYTNSAPTEGLATMQTTVVPTTGTINWTNVRGTIDQQVARTSGTSTVFQAQISANIGDSGGGYVAFDAGSVTGGSANKTAYKVGTGFTAIFDVPADATAGTTTIAGRIPIRVNGAIKYIHYHDN